MTRNRKYLLASAPVVSLVALALLVAASATFARAQSTPFLAQFHTIGALTSTVPANGDINPYGVAVVPTTTGGLTAGNILVSNFNNQNNLQGTGTTIVQLTPGGTQSVFAQIDAKKLPQECPGGVGLTTALVALSSGWVIVGSLPTTDGTAANSGAGCLIVLDSTGNVAEVFSGAPINGPWDMTAHDAGATATLFFTNVLNGTLAASPNVVHQGTVVRMVLAIEAHKAPKKVSETVIGMGFPERTDPAALVIGPTGLALGNGTLYIADSLDNRIGAIANALTITSSAGIGQDVAVGGALDDPLGLTIVPNGDLVAVNGNDGKAVEVTPAGAQIAIKVLDNTITKGGKNGGGALFGLAPVPSSGGLYFVDDNTNTLNLLH